MGFWFEIVLVVLFVSYVNKFIAVSYTHLRAHETPEHLVCRLLLEKKKNKKNKRQRLNI